MAATNPSQFRFKAREVFQENVLSTVDEDVSQGLRKNKSEPVMASNTNINSSRKTRRSLIQSSGSRFGFWKQSTDLITKMTKPMLVKYKSVYWKGFIFLRTSDNIYERKFTILCKDRILMMNKTPILHMDMVYENASTFIIPPTSIHVDISVSRIRKVAVPVDNSSTTSTFVCGMPHTLELHCEALPKVFLFPSKNDLQEFETITSQLMKLYSNYYPNNVNKSSDISLQDDIVPSSSVLWRGWVSIVRKTGNLLDDNSSSSTADTNSAEQGGEKNSKINSAVEKKLRRYVLLLDSQRFVVSTAPPLLFASDHEINSILNNPNNLPPDSPSSSTNQHKQHSHWGSGGYFKIPKGTEEDDISLIKTNTVVCFDLKRENITSTPIAAVIPPTTNTNKQTSQTQAQTSILNPKHQESIQEKILSSDVEVEKQATQDNKMQPFPTDKRPSTAAGSRKEVVVDLSLPLGLQLSDQCLITAVDKGRQCDKMGSDVIRAGQCITAVNGQPVTSKQDLLKLFSAVMLTNNHKKTKLEVFESYLEKGFDSIYEFDAVMGAVGGGVVEASEALRESIHSEKPIKEVNSILIDEQMKNSKSSLKGSQKKEKKVVQINDPLSERRKSQFVNEQQESEDNVDNDGDDKSGVSSPCIRIISKTSKKLPISLNRNTNSKQEENEELCIVIDVICEKAATPELAAKEAHLELKANMPTTLFKEANEKFLSTAEMMRTGGFGNSNSKLPSSLMLRNAIVTVRKNGGCSWRKVPTLSGDYLLISAATGRAGLWQSASLQKEFIAAKSAVEEASSKLASLPIISYPVIHLATRGRQLKRFLTVNSYCIQRTCLEFSPNDPNDDYVLNGILDDDNGIGQEDFCDINGSENNEVSQQSSPNYHGSSNTSRSENVDNVNFFEKATKIIVNRTILFSDLISIASFLAPLPSANTKASSSSSLTSRVSQRRSLSFTPSTSTSLISSNGNGKKSVLTSSRSTFLFKIQEDGNVNDVDQLNNTSSSSATPSTASSSTSPQLSATQPLPANSTELYHQRARGRLRIEATVSDGKIATWYSGRARRKSTEINEAFPSPPTSGFGGSGAKRQSSAFDSLNESNKGKKKRNERSFIYETGYANKLEEQIQVRWKLFEMQSNLTDSNHATAQYSSRNTSKYLSTKQGDTLFQLEMRKKHSEMVDFLYGPAVKINNRNRTGSSESGITAPVLGAIEAFVSRVGHENILAECAYFIEDFVQYLMERFFTIMLEASSPAVSSETSSVRSSVELNEGSSHGERARSSSIGGSSHRSSGGSSTAVTSGEKSDTLSPQPPVRDQEMIEAEQAFRLQLHRLVVDTLIVPVLGERLWLSALDQNMNEDEAFSRGILMLMQEENERSKASNNNDDENKVSFDVSTTSGDISIKEDKKEEDNEDENDVIKKLDEERLVDWDGAAQKLGALEHTMNPSDQLDVIKAAVDIITNSPPRPVAKEEDKDSKGDAEVKEATALQPMSADELIPAFIKVVSRAASKAAQRSTVGITENNKASSILNNNAVMSSSYLPPMSLSETYTSSNFPSTSGGVSSRHASFRNLESGGLLSPSSTVCYMRALIPNDLLVSEPGFILALLEGAVAFISSQSEPLSESVVTDKESISSFTSSSSSRRSSSRRSSARRSFRPSDAIRERLERGLSISHNSIYELPEEDIDDAADGDNEMTAGVISALNNNSDPDQNIVTEGEDMTNSDGIVSPAPSSSLWGASSSMTVTTKRASSSVSKQSLSQSSNTSFDVWRNSALQEAYAEVDSGSSDEEGI